VCVRANKVVAVLDAIDVPITSLSIYFARRALSKKLRAEELLKLAKLPPSMAKREEEKRKTEKLDDIELRQLELAANAKNSVDFSPNVKKKKYRKKLRKTKSAIGGTRNQFAKSYIFDTKRDRDKGSVRVNKYECNPTAGAKCSHVNSLSLTHSPMQRRRRTRRSTARRHARKYHPHRYIP
jgi:hypothetical protein